MKIERKNICSLILATVTFFIFLCSLPQANGKDITTFNKDSFIESAKTNKVIKVGLTDCITYALENNSEVKIKRIEPELREDDIKIAKSVFEPTFSLEYLFHDNTKPSSIPFLSGDALNKREDTLLNADITGKLTPGTIYSIEFLNYRYKTNSKYQEINPAYELEPKFTITQPLLKNFGSTVNRAEIIITQNTKQETLESFKNTVMDTISATKIAYYNYYFSIKNYFITKLSLKRTRDLLKINKARYNKGLISSVDLLEAETAVFQKMKTLISAESNLRKAEDNLKLITNLVDDPAAWNAALKLLDSPEFNIRKTDLVESLLNAFQYRPDYNAQKIDLENRDIKIKLAKNALLPTLDLVGSFGLNGLGETFNDALDSINSDYKDWSVGTRLSIPWGGGNRAQYDKTILEKAQALIGFKRLEQNIILEVRNYAREVSIQYRQIEATKISRDKENKNYKAQKARYSAGHVSTHDMLDYQDKLVQAELDYIKALIDYNIALTNLDKAEGLTLTRNNVCLEEK